MTTKKPSINRVLSEEQLVFVEKNLKFLTNYIKDSYGELDMQIRNKYISIYYKGNSLAKITPNVKDETFKFEIHKAFNIKEVIAKLKDHRFTPEEKIFKNSKANNDYDCAKITIRDVHPFFQKKVINGISSNIKSYNTRSEEIAFEQSIMTDNIGNINFFIIDRQVTISNYNKNKIDLLALKKRNENDDIYDFVILEVKLGNNSELKEKVYYQLNKYSKMIKDNLRSFQKCYEINYQQKRKIGIIGDENWPKFIQIGDKVMSKIVVGFYSGIGKRHIEQLRKKFPGLKDHIYCFWKTLP